jgi:hypothetical protein
MGDDLKHRLGGMALLLLAAASVWAFVVSPLRQAAQGRDSIEFFYTPLLGIGLFLPMGLFLLIAGNRIPYRDAATYKMKPVGWAILLVGLALAGGLWWWMEQQFTALGYR